jgi:hypothetical protein
VPVLKGLKKLGVLNLQQTQITAARVEELRLALPECKIDADGDMNVAK